MLINILSWVRRNEGATTRKMFVRQKKMETGREAWKGEVQVVGP
jgi:hypothetical protein